MIAELMDEFFDLVVKLERAGVIVEYQSDPNLLDGYYSIRLELDLPKSEWNPDEEE